MSFAAKARASGPAKRQALWRQASLHLRACFLDSSFASGVTGLRACFLDQRSKDEASTLRQASARQSRDRINHFLENRRGVRRFSEGVVRGRPGRTLRLIAPAALCRRRAAPLDDHVLGCRKGGGRQLGHTTLKRAVLAAASAAQLAPRSEPAPFRSDTGRVDVEMCGFRVGERLLVDVAVVIPLRSACLSAAASSPGGAATAYEKTKHRRYDAAAAATDSHMTVAPLVWDTLGAAGATANRWMFLAARGTAARRWLAPSRVMMMMRERFAATVIGGAAQILATTSWQEEAARLEQFKGVFSAAEFADADSDSVPQSDSDADTTTRADVNAPSSSSCSSSCSSCGDCG